MQLSLGARHDFLRRFGVPEGWTPCELGSLARLVGGGTPSRDESRYWNGGSIPWATPTDLTANRSKFIDRTAECITDAGLKESAATMLPVGAVLYTSRATIGAKAIAKVPIATNQGFASFVPTSVNGDYLYYLLDLLTPTIKRLASGTTFDEVSKRDIRKVWCAVPEAESGEQAAIELVLDVVDTAVQCTRTAMSRARDVKKSLAQELFSKGTRGEPQKKTAIGSIPRSWNVVSVESVTREFQYGLSVPMQLEGAIPILRMGNIQAGDVVFNELKYVSLPVRITAPYVVKRGDVLFNRTNSQEWVGKVGVYRLDVPVVFASYLIRVVPDPEKADNYFLGQLLDSYPIQCRIKRYATPGVQQVNINATNLGKVLIPMPTGKTGLDEQRDIAAILENADTVIRNYQPVFSAQQELKKSLMHDLLTGRMRVPVKKLQMAVDAA
jgi:type I restriction enzyme, S subunit